MDKYQVLTILFFVSLIFASLNSIIDIKDEPRHEIEIISFVSVNELISKRTGWVNQTSRVEGPPGGNSNGSFELKINLPNENITYLQFNITVIDSDRRHSYSDEESQPDEISITFKDEKSVTKSIESNLTPLQEFISFNTSLSDDGSYLSTNWIINISCGCKGGKEYVGFVPERFIFIDQGFWFGVTGNYSYEFQI